MSHAASDPLGVVGSTIAEKYRVEEVIGEGGFGVVYRGTHLMLREPIAIKFVKGMEMQEGFLREARVLFSLTHPGIVRLYDLGAGQTRLGRLPYVVLELVRGTTVETEIERRVQSASVGFAGPEILAMFEPIFEALAFAHHRKIAHRDIKPSNVMLIPGEDGGVSAKLLDFGTARSAINSFAGARTLAPAAATSAVGFTPRYAAPEQWDPSIGTTGPASDIFSLGLLLAEVCTLTPLLVGDSPFEIMKQVMNRNRIVSISARRYDLPRGLDEIVSRATRVSPPERFASVAELRDALRATLWWRGWWGR